MLHVAVVDRASVQYGGRKVALAPYKHFSDRPEGDYAAFLGSDREDVIQRALAARAKWGRHVYRVLVGTLTTEAEESANYRLRVLDDENVNEQGVLQ